MIQKMANLLVVWAVYSLVVTIVSLPIWAMLIIMGGVTPWMMLVMPIGSIFALLGLYSQYGKAKDE